MLRFIVAAAIIATAAAVCTDPKVRLLMNKLIASELYPEALRQNLISKLLLILFTFNSELSNLQTIYYIYKAIVYFVCTIITLIYKCETKKDPGPFLSSFTNFFILHLFVPKLVRF